MARFESSGIDELLADMKRMGELSGPTADKMLMAGAEIEAGAWKDAINQAGLVDKHDMINAVKPSKFRIRNDLRQIDVYPQGKDRKGVRNAEKAFINHYGTSSSTYPATHFVDRAEEAAAPLIQSAYEKIWDDFLKGQG